MVGFSGNESVRRSWGKDPEEPGPGLATNGASAPREQRFERFPPEPFCYLAARVVRGRWCARRRRSSREDARSIDVRLAGLAPPASRTSSYSYRSETIGSTRLACRAGR
jgi:hypothetical protein